TEHALHSRHGARGSLPAARDGSLGAGARPGPSGPHACRRLRGVRPPRRARRGARDATLQLLRFAGDRSPRRPDGRHAVPHRLLGRLMPDAVVELRGVTKRFAAHVAVRDLSLSVPRGVIYGLLGPNGAGKTTSIRMINDIVKPDAVTIT